MVDEIKKKIIKKISESDIINYNYNKIILGEGKYPTDKIIVGEAPGELEDIIGRPFVGKSGSILNFTLDSVGLNREDIFITNVFFIRPINNRTPSQNEIDLCKDELLELILNCQATKIMCLGRVSSIFFQRNNSCFKHACIIENYHPAYILRKGGINSSEFQIFLKKFQLFKEL